MCPRVQTCLLLLVGVLTSPGRGGTIGNRDDRIYFDSAVGADPSGEDPHANHPLWKTRPESSHLQNVRASSPGVGGVEHSRFTLEQAPTTSALLQTSPGWAQQLGNTEPPMVYKPLLDEDQLVAFELNKLKTTLPPPTSTSISGEATAPVAVAVSDQPEGDADISSQLAEVLKSILNETEVQRQSTTQRPRQPPSVDLVSRKPPVDSTSDTAKFQDFLPQLKEALKGVLTKHESAELQPPSTVHMPLLKTPRVPPSHTEKDLKHILLTLEETLSSILKNSESKISGTTSNPALQPVHPTTTDSRRPSQTLKGLPTETKEDLEHILPTLEEALGSIFEDSEAKILSTTSHPALSPVHRTPTDSTKHFVAVLPQLEDKIRSILEEAASEQEAAAKQHTSPVPAWQYRPPTTKDSSFVKFVPELKRVFGDILSSHKSNQNSTFPNTTVLKGTMETPIHVSLSTEQHPPS